MEWPLYYGVTFDLEVQRRSKKRKEKNFFLIIQKRYGFGTCSKYNLSTITLWENSIWVGLLQMIAMEIYLLKYVP